MSTKTLTVRTVDDWTTPHPGADNVRIEVDELVSRTDLGASRMIAA